MPRTTANWHRYRSISLLQLDRVAEALEAAEQARALDPDDARNELVRAEALLRRSGTRTVLAAEVATGRARELDPENTWAHFTEATVQRRMAEFGRARAAYLEALRLAPDNPAALHGLGTLDAERGRAVRAAPVLGGMLQVEPNNPAALRAATFGARQMLWTLTDLGCLLLLLANLVVLVIQESVPSGPLAAAVGMTVTTAAGAGVLALLHWRLARLPGPVRALLRANRHRPTVAAAPLRLAALVIAASVISLDPFLPEAVEEMGAILFSVTLLTLLLRWRNRAVREFFWFVRRCWFRLHRRPAAEP